MPKTSKEHFYLIYKVESLDQKELLRLINEIESLVGMRPTQVLDSKERPIQYD